MYEVIAEVQDLSIDIISHKSIRMSLTRLFLSIHFSSILEKTPADRQKYDRRADKLCAHGPCGIGRPVQWDELSRCWNALMRFGAQMRVSCVMDA